MMLVRSSLTNPNLLHNVTQIIEMRWWLDILELLSSQVMIDWNPVSFNKALIVNLDSSSKNKSHSVVSDSLWPNGLSSPWNSPSKKSGVNCHFLFQGIFPTQGSNLGLLHSRQILYRPSHCFLSIPPINCGGGNSTSCSLAIWGFFSWTTSELHRIYYFHSGV